MIRVFIKVISRVTLLAASGLYSLAALAQTPAENLTGLLGHTSTLTAQVSQLTLDQQGREVQEFKALLSLSKPDHFYWHATEPYEQVMVTNGEKLWIYEPDLDQVTIDPFNSDYSRTPAMLLSADADTLASLYDISENDGVEGEQRFVLMPLQPDSLFTRLSLTFSGSTLTEMQFEDSLGQKTSMSFHEVRTNMILPPATFVFEPPMGTDILDSTAD